MSGVADASNKSSNVWKYFTVLPNKQKTKCSLCDIELSYRGGGTSTMKKHLDAKHSFVSLSSTEPKQENKQPTRIDAHFVRPVSRERYIDFTSKAVLACVRDLRPLSIFEGVGMRDFLQALNPGYTPPTHTTVPNYLTKLYDTAKGSIMEQLRRKAVSLTTDMWTSCATDGYITVTCHFINEKWEMTNFVLATRELSVSHTGENIGNCLSDLKTEFDLSEIVGITTDNASNMSSACKTAGAPRVKCFAHTLQLAVNEGLSLQSIANMTMHARKLTAFFSKSVLASNALTAIQTKLEKKTKGVIVDVCTRWNSTFMMIERLQAIKPDLYSVLISPEFSKHRHLLLKDHQWTLIEHLLPVLKVLTESTELLCGEAYPTCSDVFPLVFGLMKNHLNPSDLNSGVVRDFKLKVVDGLKKRMLSESDNIPFFLSIPALASVLDPRYKRLKFLAPEQRERTLGKIRELLRGDVGDAAPDVPAIKPDPDQPSCPLKKPKLEQHTSALHFIMGDIIEIDETEETYDELDAYLADPAKPLEGSLLAFWKASSDRFPGLAALARKLLSVPATSVPSERAFSTAGLTITEQRSALDPETADAIIFLNKNFKHSKALRVAPPVAPATATVAAATATVAEATATVGEATGNVKLEKTPPLPNMEAS